MIVERGSNTKTFLEKRSKTMKIKLCRIISSMTSYLREGFDATILRPNQNDSCFILYTTNEKIATLIASLGDNQGVRIFPGAQDIITFEISPSFFKSIYHIMAALKTEFGETVDFDNF